MQVTIIGVYENLNEARETREELELSGLSPGDIQLAQEGQEAGASGGSQQQGGIKGFFKNLFGADEGQDASMYEEAVQRGNYVLTVMTEEEKLGIAADVMNRHQPLNLSGDSGALIEADQTYSSDVTAKPAATQTSGTSSTQSIPIVEEQLKVGKRSFDRGGVRVYQRVIEKPIEENISLQEEQVTVERTPANRPATTEDLQSFKEGSFELRERAEEAVVEKSARVVEEVRIGKETRQRTQKISDTVKRTQVDIEKSGAESGYQTHFQQTYGSSGGRYDEYAPAYDFGGTAYADARYQGRSWNDAELDVRRDWEKANPGGTWDKVKDAVRHAWDKASMK